MKITLSGLKERGACKEGLKWFRKKFKSGADYQTVLEALDEKNGSIWMRWLLHAYGESKEIKVVDGNLESEDMAVFPGCLHVTGNIFVKSLLVKGWVQVDGRVEVENFIDVSRHLRVAGNVKAAGNITIGEEFRTGGTARSGGEISADWMFSSGSIVASRSIRSSGGIKAHRSISAGCSLLSGGSIHSGGSIRAKHYIKSGFFLTAARTIKVGEDYGIYAGHEMRISEREFGSVIRARKIVGPIVVGNFEARHD